MSQYPKGEFCVTVAMTASGPNAQGQMRTFQEITINEYSDDADLHNQKAMGLGAGVMGAFAQMAAQAKIDGAAKK